MQYNLSMKFKYKLKQKDTSFKFSLFYSYMWVCGDGCCSDTEHESTEGTFKPHSEFTVFIEVNKERYYNGEEKKPYHINRWAVISGIELYMFNACFDGPQPEYEYSLELTSEDITIRFEELCKYFEIERIE
jgi:hypothetical protein